MKWRAGDRAADLRQSRRFSSPSGVATGGIRRAIRGFSDFDQRISIKLVSLSYVGAAAKRAELVPISNEKTRILWTRFAMLNALMPVDAF